VYLFLGSAGGLIRALVVQYTRRLPLVGRLTAYSAFAIPGGFIVARRGTSGRAQLRRAGQYTKWWAYGSAWRIVSQRKYHVKTLSERGWLRRSWGGSVAPRALSSGLFRAPPQKGVNGEQQLWNRSWLAENRIRSLRLPLCGKGGKCRKDQGCGRIRMLAGGLDDLIPPSSVSMLMSVTTRSKLLIPSVFLAGLPDVAVSTSMMLLGWAGDVPSGLRGLGKTPTTQIARALQRRSHPSQLPGDSRFAFVGNCYLYNESECVQRVVCV
jgi:hypothetical protein